MTAVAGDATCNKGGRAAVDEAKQFHECPNDGRDECFHLADRRPTRQTVADRQESVAHGAGMADWELIADARPLHISSRIPKSSLILQGAPL